MRTVELIAVYIDGFKCFRPGSGTVVEFPDHGGLFHMTGENEAEPRMDSNGVGKSAFWDAVSWCWYSVTSSDERASDVQTWGTDARPQVATSVSIDNDIHVITRTGSPNRLTVDDEEVAQETVNALLGLSKARFFQSVLFGQSATLFMDLTVPERGVLMDEVMGLGMWLELSKYAGSRVAEARRVVIELERSTAYTQGQISTETDNLTSLQQSSQQWQTDHAQQLRQLQDELDAATVRADQLAHDLADASLDPAGDGDKVDEMAAIWSRIQQERAAVEHDIQHIKRAITFLAFDVLAEDRVCPTCLQHVSEEYDIHTRNKLEQVDLPLLNSKLAKLIADENEAAALLNSLHDARIQHEDKVNQLTSERRIAIAQVAHAEQALSRFQQADPYAELIAHTYNSIQTLHASLQQDQDAITTMQTDLAQLEYWEQAFKRVRLFRLRRVLTLLEVEAANAASSLGISHWQIKFNTETETKSGNLRLGIYIDAINKDGHGTYKSFSGGESHRVRLAVSMGLAAHIQACAGVRYAMEIWDEPTTWLSPRGIDDLVECLRQRADITGKAVWLLDQRSLHHPFDAVWHITKRISGSTIEIR